MPSPTVTNSYQNSGKKFTSLTVSGVQAQGTNRGFVVFIWGGGKVGGESVTACVWDSGGGNEFTLTKLTEFNNGNANVVIFHGQGDGNIAAATQDMLITADNQWSWTGGGVIVLSLDNMDPTTGVNNEGTANGVDTLSVTSSSGDLVAGIINELDAGNTITPGTGDTEHQDVVQDDTHGVVNTDPSTGASESVDWSGPTTTRIIAAINIIAGPEPAPVSPQTHQMML